MHINEYRKKIAEAYPWGSPTGQRGSVDIPDSAGNGPRYSESRYYIPGEERTFPAPDSDEITDPQAGW
jgi:hypothetical protein